MRLHNLGWAVGVRIPREASPAFHVCRYPVPAPTVELGRMVVPRFVLEPWDRGALAVASLQLPQEFAATTFILPPKEIAGAAVDPRWVEADGLPIAIPAEVEAVRRFQREWRMAPLRTPSSLGVAFPTDVIKRVGWAVICRARPSEVIEALAGLALKLECDPVDCQQAVAQMMELPPAVRHRVVATSAGGDALLAPRCVRWLLCELAAADHDDLAAARRWSPPVNGDADLMARSWFRCLRSDSRPTTGELLSAIWLLHEDYHGCEPTSNETVDLLAMVSAVSFDARSPGTWADTLDRWLAIWSVPDAHPTVQQAQRKPSAVRSLFEQQVGSPPTEWLAGIWLLQMRWLHSVLHSEMPPTDRTSLLNCDLDGDAVSLTGAFESALDQWLVGSIEEIGRAARNEAGNAYSGLGSLPQTDLLALRNSPLLALPGGRLFPISLELIAERATQVHRWAFSQPLGGARAANHPIGPLFEAWVHDQLSRLARNHTVLHETDLAAVTTASRRADAVPL